MTATETKREKELRQDVANFDIEMELEESSDAEGRPIRKKKPMSVPPITTNRNYLERILPNVIQEMVKVIHTHPFKGLMIARRLFGVPEMQRGFRR